MLVALRLEVRSARRLQADDDAEAVAERAAGLPGDGGHLGGHEHRLEEALVVCPEDLAQHLAVLAAEDALLVHDHRQQLPQGCRTGVLHLQLRLEADHLQLELCALVRQLPARHALHCEVSGTSRRCRLSVTHASTATLSSHHPCTCNCKGYAEICAR